MKNIVISLVVCTLFISCSFIQIELNDKSALKIPDDTLIISPDITYEVIDDLTKGCLRGVIVDGNNESVPFANVVLRGTQIGAQANEAGEFSICNIEAGMYDLFIQQMGYHFSLIENLEILGGKSAIIDSIFLQNQPLQVDKPIIYLYPQEITKVTVKLDYDGKLLYTYPKYNNGWKVKAHPDGTLFDENGKEYYALYWEGKPNKKFNINEGFVIAGEKSVEFLEITLEKLGLNRKEANEFIIYWLPKLESNPYNLIHFSTSEYVEMAKLNINPFPDTIIRIMMVLKQLDKPISIKEQDLSLLKKERKGFTVVEWGGCLLP